MYIGITMIPVYIYVASFEGYKRKKLVAMVMYIIIIHIHLTTAFKTTKEPFEIACVTKFQNNKRYTNTVF